MAMYGYALKDKQNEKKIAELLVALPSQEIFFLVHSDAGRSQDDGGQGCLGTDADLATIRAEKVKRAFAHNLVIP